METDIISENGEISIDTKLPDYTVSQIMFQINNNADNTKLIVDSCYLYNVYGKIDKTEDIANMYLSSNLIDLKIFDRPNTLFMGDSLISETFYVSPQTIKKWYPLLMPSENDTYVKIHGKIITNINGSNEFELYNGEMFIPITGQLLAFHQNIFKLTLKNQCPWYIFMKDSVMTKVLVEIQFNPQIKDWEKVQNIPIEK
jgi:hypothetical protein